MVKMAKREDELSDYGTPESWKREAKELVLRDAKSGHAVNAKTISYLQRLEREGVIEYRHVEAGEIFNSLFFKCGLERYSTINLFRVLGTAGDETRQIENRQKMRGALEALAGLQASIIWHVCGNEKSLSEWVLNKRGMGARINVNDARGILIAALDKLAKHFGK